MIGTCAAPDGEQTITTGKTRRGRRDEITRVAESTTRSRLITEQRVLPLKQESNAADNPRARATIMRESLPASRVHPLVRPPHSGGAKHPASRDAALRRF